MASGLTFGSPSAPNNITTYLDALFSTSLANYSKGFKDNISSTNAFMHDLMNGGGYKSADGGTYITEQLMYALAPSDSYAGYDVLASDTVDGITQAAYEWRQVAAPISYNMKEVTQNQHKLVDLVDAKIQQAEMGIQEGWAQAMMWGNATQGGNLWDAKVSMANGSLNIDPLALLVNPTPSASIKVGGIDQSLQTWWRNNVVNSAATTYDAFFYELENMYNTCALRAGGPPTHVLMDQVTYQLFVHSYYKLFKTAPEATDGAYPFVAKKFFNAKIIMDDKVPDYYSNAVGTFVAGAVDPTTLTYGTAIFLNDRFFNVRYQTGRNFEMLKDENGKTFSKPINGDSRLGHVAWMGNMTISNRRKQGILDKIPRTLS